MGAKNIENYFKSLYLRISEARILKREKVKVENWEPTARMCHDNVDTFCDYKPDHTPVRGWLFFELKGLNKVKFNAHSVVQTPQGDLIEITPSNASKEYPFIKSALSDDDYIDIIKNFTNGEIFYIPQNGTLHNSSF